MTEEFWENFLDGMTFGPLRRAAEFDRIDYGLLAVNTILVTAFMQWLTTWTHV